VKTICNTTQFVERITAWKIHLKVKTKLAAVISANYWEMFSN